MFNAMYDLRHTEKPNVFVELKYPDKSTKCLQLEYKSQSGSLSDAMQEFYVYFLLWTKDPVKERPETVALTLDKDCSKDKLSNSISVQGLVPGPNAVKYAVCLHKALFGISDPQVSNYDASNYYLLLLHLQVVVDWVEINRELGAELLMLYYQDVPEIMYTVLQPYIKTGLLEVIDWSLKEPSIPKMHTLDNGMSAVINECIYRSMNRVKYLSLTDIDEFIVPEAKFEKVGDMMEYLEEQTKSKPVSAYRFHNTYYFEDPVSVPQVKDVSLCSKMKLPRYFRRTQRATHAEKYGSDKLVVKTKAVNVAQVHFVVDKQKEYEAEYEVPNDIGRSNHYRWPYRMADFTPHEYSDIMGRYAATVIPKIKSVMCKSDEN